MHYAGVLHLQLFTYSIIELIINYQFYSLVISSVRLLMGIPVVFEIDIQWQNVPKTFGAP